LAASPELARSWRFLSRSLSFWAFLAFAIRFETEDGQTEEETKWAASAIVLH
jgi:hypothetical protein